MSLTVDVFVSSPGDLALERKVVGEVVAKLALQPHLRRSCSLRAHFYEQMVPPVLASSAQAVVNTFMMDPARCQVLVCLLGDRMGSPVTDPALDGRTFRSGTEYELVAAYESRHRPRPAVLVYFRSESPGPVDPLERQRLKEFLTEFEGPQAKFRGMRPAAFANAEQLRGQLTDHLNAVVTPLVRGHTVRQLMGWAGGLVALVAAALLTYAATRRAESTAWQAQQTVLEERHATEEAEAVLRAALDVEGPWKEVQALDRLGCPAATSLLNALATVDAHLGPSLRTHAIVAALGRLGASPESATRCGCASLLSILTVVNPLRRFCKNTHRLALEELGNLTCAERDRVVCEYLGKIRAVSPLRNVVCEGDMFDDVNDLVGVVRPWMGEARMTACLNAGRAP